ncbi:response regulator [Candidatus Scalindua japonica]|uniref:Response regulator n=1 Tax=Candidatus Scalindua japonica TaxID=1284222 RepID=A0A286TYA6_9BACT|nr:sigma-54 dependent transcriptional regulator [Candidatus Scalindua japonica]GAX60875.1 response regulator [Candidatus Scalindua japonica]
MEGTKRSEMKNTFKLREEPELWRIIGSSKEIKDVLAKIQTVLESDIPVVIHGETGTGKELVTKAIHYRGPRSKQALCTINCAAIPENLLESELMGHEKGAFTGAVQQQVGKLERANMGTLFLDEITEMPLTMQAKILRVIEEQVFERVGGQKLIQTNVRIISASNKELLSEVNSKNFREDLYYRLNVFRIHIPPLRDRKEDIPELVNVFVNRFDTLSGKKINKVDPSAMDKLKTYHWPGNIRQLQNSIRRAILITPNDTLLPEHFDFPDMDSNGLRMTESLEDGLSKLEAALRRGDLLPLSEVEEIFIRRTLNATNGNISAASEKLDIGRSTVYRKMQEYGIKIEDYQSGE